MSTKTGCVCNVYICPRGPPSSLVQRVVAETEGGGWEECGVTLSLTTHPGPACWGLTCVERLRLWECWGMLRSVECGVTLSLTTHSGPACWGITCVERRMLNCWGYGSVEEWWEVWNVESLLVWQHIQCWDLCWGMRVRWGTESVELLRQKECWLRNG